MCRWLAVILAASLAEGNVQGHPSGECVCDVSLSSCTIQRIAVVVQYSQLARLPVRPVRSVRPFIHLSVPFNLLSWVMIRPNDAQTNSISAVDGRVPDGQERLATGLACAWLPVASPSPVATPPPRHSFVAFLLPTNWAPPDKRAACNSTNCQQFNCYQPQLQPDAHITPSQSELFFSWFMETISPNFTPV